MTKNRVDANCKYCLSIGLSIREKLPHSMLHCERVHNFWGQLRQTIAHMNNTYVFNDVSKIFGVENNSEIRTVKNLLIFAAQKSIYLTRLKQENRDKNVDI